VTTVYEEREQTVGSKCRRDAMPYRGRLRCAECGGQLHSVKPWRVEDVLGKPLGRRG
jgi:hypothetical protein